MSPISAGSRSAVLISAGFRTQPARRAAAVLLLVPLALGSAPAPLAPRAALAPVALAPFQPAAMPSHRPVTTKAVPIPNPILFVTQVPIPSDFTTVGSVFGNHLSSVQSAGRGGDLYILYPSGTLRNLTQEAGFGNAGLQGAGSIAVREPTVHWSGTKALFSMVVGATTERYRYIDTWWQIYEVTGLGPNDHAVITKIARQPADANNVSPLYAPDGRILFTSDRTRGGERHLYPQLDEYEEAATNTGLWSLDPASGDLRLLDHAPSGAFRPIVDSFGRVVYTRWDHLQRDQQADAGGNPYGTFDYADESAGAAKGAGVEIFPEPRAERQDLLAGTPFEGHSFNHFFPWQINPDGTEHETLNHIGRHELHNYFNRDRHDDADISEFIGAGSRFNPNSILNFLQIQEDPRTPGRFIGVDAPEFRTHASGLVVALDAPPSLPADRIRVTYLTHPSTGDVTDEGQSPAPENTGHYRNPLPLSDGGMLAVHAAETREDDNTGTRQQPGSRYAFRLKKLETGPGGYLRAGAPLTPGLSKTVSYWDPDELVSYSGELWELDPVEVKARPAPPVRSAPFEGPERGIFESEGVDPAALRAWLNANGLALMVTRNVTTRDEADRQQPFNLRVAGGGTTSTGSNGRIYDVSHLQIFQADQLRGLGGAADPRAGRRVLARTLHDPKAKNPVSNGPAGSVRVAPDGSAAAFVPARRALTWQLTDPGGQGVLRERYWLTFQPGEIRVCTSCHGPNSRDQRGQAPAANPPEALRSLLRFWKQEVGAGCVAGPTTLCLNQGRFKVEVAWKDFAGNSGVGRAVPLTADTGTFWFFSPENVEVVLKVLDGRGVNGKFWVFYGALSSVEYTLTVTDTQTGGVKTYRNPPGTLASVGDTGALPGAASTGASALAADPAPAAPAVSTLASHGRGDRAPATLLGYPAPAAGGDLAGAKATCAANAETLCLNGGRFKVEIDWKDFSGGTGKGKGTALTGDTGSFWFFSPANLEVVVKVLDGRTLNGKWWVFFGALSSVEYTVKVTDTLTNTTKTYRNPSGRLASVADTSAF